LAFVQVAGPSSDAKILEIPSIVPRTIAYDYRTEPQNSAYRGISLRLCLKKKWFQGHSKEISHVQWSPNGKEIATASKDRTVVVWDTKKRPRNEKPSKCFPNFSWQKGKDCNMPWWGRVKLTLKGHSGPVNCVAYNADGRQIATASSDKTVRVWNAQTGKTIHTLRSHSNDVTCVAWSTLGLLASTSADQSTIVWNGKSGQQLVTLKGHVGEVTCAAWSPSGDCLATTSGDHSAILWLIEGQKKLHTLNGHKAKVTSVAWNSDGKFLVTASFDNSIIVWDSKAGGGIRYEGFHYDWINSVAWCPVTNLIATASDDSTARVVDTTLGTSTEGISLGPSQQVTCVSWCPKGNYLVTASSDKFIEIYCVAHSQCWEVVE
jgi:WD40 repeat protein